MKIIKNKLIATETQEQIALIEYAKKTNAFWRPYIIHIPNEAKRSWLGYIQQEKMGTKKGVSDLFLAYPFSGKAGLWIEMKRRDEHCKASKAQSAWLALMTSVGYGTGLAYGWEHGLEIINTYLKKDS